MIKAISTVPQFRRDFAIRMEKPPTSDKCKWQRWIETGNRQGMEGLLRPVGIQAGAGLAIDPHRESSTGHGLRTMDPDVT